MASKKRCEAFFPVFRFHWLHASGATIGSYMQPVGRNHPSEIRRKHALMGLRRA